MTKAQLIAYINAWIKDNNNKEITAAIMRDVLDKVVQYIDDSVGNVQDIVNGETVVGAINLLFQMFNDLDVVHPINKFEGADNPNNVPPSGYNVGDLYVRNGNQLYQYNGATWVRIVDSAGGIRSIVAGDNVSVDNSDPLNPIINAIIEDVEWNELKGDQSSVNLSGFTNDLDIPTLQEVTDSGAATDHVIELEGVKFNELRVTGAVSTILGTTETRPFSITIDSEGNIYTTNSGSSNVSKITPDGVSTILGTTGTNPFGITIDSEGNVYTANTVSNNVSKITPSGTSSILGTTGNRPFNIVIDSEGNIYTVNQGSNNVSKITPSGVSTILGNTGTNPSGITIDSEGNIYTSNYDSNNVSKITPDGVSTILGTTGSNPRGITIDSEGSIYTANYISNNVTKITPSGVSTILGTTGSNPYGITIDSEGNIYTANSNSNDVSKITPDGVSTILGTTGSSPTIITIDSGGNIYTTNFNSNNVTKIIPAPKDEFLSLDENGNIIVKKTPANSSESASTLQEVTDNGSVTTKPITSPKFIDSDGTEMLTGTEIDLSNNIDGTIYNNVTPSVAASFSVINLKSGGFATNYIDTTGKTDFPTVTNAAGLVIPTQSDAFRADAEFLMVLETLNSEDVEVFFSDYLNLDPMPSGASWTQMTQAAYDAADPKPSGLILIVG